MTLRHLRIFVSVYQTGSMTQAAKKLWMSQPSVSLAIRELEKYYGVLLFDRIGRKIYPTDQGKRLYEYALHIVALFEEMEKGVRDWESLGALRVGASITTGNHLLPVLIEEFGALYPDVCVTATVCNSSDVERAVLDNRVDLALVEGAIDTPQIVRVPFMHDRLCVICAPNSQWAARGSIAVEALAREKLLLRESGSAGREILDSIFSQRQLKVAPVLESISTQAIVRATARGLGLSVLSYLLVQSDLQAGTVCEVRLEDVSLARKFSIIHHKNKYLSPSMCAFMKICMEMGQNSDAGIKI